MHSWFLQLHCQLPLAATTVAHLTGDGELYGNLSSPSPAGAHMRKYVVHLQSAGPDSKVQRLTAEDRFVMLQARQILQ